MRWCWSEEFLDPTTPALRTNPHLLRRGLFPRRSIPHIWFLATRWTQIGKATSSQSPLVSVIFLSASSTVKVFGLCSAGNSLKVSTNFAIAA